MKLHLKISRMVKLVLPIFTTIVLVFIINQAQAGAARIKALERAIYYDKNTGLEWLPGPDRDTTWNKAKRWAESLTVVARGGWRMPTRKELKTLYKKGAGTLNMTPLLKTTGWWVWSGETKGSSSAWGFSFIDNFEASISRDKSFYARGFAVRSGKDKSTDVRLKKRSVAPSSSYSSYSSKRKTKRGGRFVAYANGTVKDTKTGLMWASKDNGKDINWKDAKRYCENYRGGGYTDWRMPTRDELAGLYDKSESYHATQKTYNVYLTKLIELSTCCPWASETRGSSAAYFYFHSGLRTWDSQSVSNHYRALPVRSGK